MTIAIVVVTCLISIAAFNDYRLFSRLQFNATEIYYHKGWYRLLTHGFLHANWTHLIINMLVFFMFGTAAERWLEQLQFHGYIRFPGLIYLLFYLSSIILASLLSMVKHKEHSWYNSVGASGAVSAILFFNIFFNPWEKVYVYALLPVPGIILGALYLVYSQYMSRKGTDNINHDAHFVGAVYGFLFPLLLDIRLFQHFMTEFLGWFR